MTTERTSSIGIDADSLLQGPQPSAYGTGIAASRGHSHGQYLSTGGFAAPARGAIRMEEALARHGRKVDELAAWVIEKREDLVGGTADTDWFDVTTTTKVSAGNRVVKDSGVDESVHLETVIAAMSAGAVLFFPAGTYTFTNAVDVTTAVTFVGEPGTIFSCTGTNPGTMGAFFQFNTAGSMDSQWNGCGIYGITFDGPGNGTDTQGIFIHYQNNFRFVNNRLLEWGDSGLNLKGCTDTLIENNRLEDVILTGYGYALLIRDDCDGTIIRRNFFGVEARHCIDFSSDVADVDHWPRTTIIEDNLFTVPTKNDDGFHNYYITSHPTLAGPLHVRNNVFHNGYRAMDLRSCALPLYFEDNVVLYCTYGIWYQPEDTVGNDRTKVDLIARNVFWLTDGYECIHYFDNGNGCGNADVHDNVFYSAGNGPKVYLDATQPSYFAVRDNVHGTVNRLVEGTAPFNLGTLNPQPEGNTFVGELATPFTGATLMHTADGWNLSPAMAPTMLKPMTEFDGSVKLQVGAREDYNFLHNLTATSKWAISGFARFDAFTGNNVILSTAGITSGNVGVCLYTQASTRNLILLIVNGSGYVVFDYGVTWPNDNNWHHFTVNMDWSVAGCAPMSIDFGALTGTAGKGAAAPVATASTYAPFLGGIGNNTSLLDGGLCDIRVWRDLNLSTTTGLPTFEPAATVTFSDAEGDPAALGVSAADGTSTYPARRDHVHIKPSAADIGAAASGHTHAIGDLTDVDALPSNTTTYLRGDGTWATPAGGSAAWTAWPVSYTGAPATTSTITSTDATATVKVGYPVRYTIGGVVLYGIVTAISATTVTIAGASLTGTISDLQYGDPARVVQMPFLIPGYFEDAASSNLIAEDLGMLMQWAQGAAYCVRVRARNRVADTGAADAVVNVTLGGTAVLSTGLTLSDANFQTSVIQIATAGYDVTLDDAIEITTAKGTNGDAQDLSCMLTFVLV